MDERKGDTVKSKADEDHAGRSIKEIREASEQGNCDGWTFNRKKIYHYK